MPTNKPIHRIIAVRLLIASLILFVMLSSVKLIPTRYEDCTEIAYIQPGRYFEIWLGTNHNINIVGITIGNYTTRTKVLAINEGETPPNISR